MRRPSSASLRRLWGSGFLAFSHSSHQVSTLPGCGFLRAVIVAMFRGQLENVAVGPSLQSFVPKRWGVFSVSQS